MTQYDHCPLIDLQPVKPVGDVETALKAKPRDQAQDDLLFKLLSKPMAPLHRMIIPALELANMPNLTKDYDDDFDPDIKRALWASSSLLRSFANYTLALHSDMMHRRKILAMTALGASKHEAEGVVVKRPSSRQRRALGTAPTSPRVPRGRSPSSGGKASKSP